MGLSDELKTKNTPLTKYNKLPGSWENYLKNLASQSHSVKGCLYLVDNVRDFFIQVYNRDCKLCISYHSFNGWDDSTTYIYIEDLKHTFKNYTGVCPPINHVREKYDFRASSNFTLLPKEECYEAARKIKSCDDGGFKKYEVSVLEFKGPAYVEEYVISATPERHAGIFHGKQDAQYETAFRAVGQSSKYAVYVDIEW